MRALCETPSPTEAALCPLELMRDWLLECEVQIAAMECTLTYRTPTLHRPKEVMETARA